VYIAEELARRLREREEIDIAVEHRDVKTPP
jgi:RNase adaptor protein for sRNA GlmZ degradation